jgi:hypothetical protein
MTKKETSNLLSTSYHFKLKNILEDLEEELAEFGLSLEDYENSFEQSDDDIFILNLGGNLSE